MYLHKWHAHIIMHMNTYMTTICMCIQDGFFPLSDASQEGYDEIVQVLLHAGATVDLQNKVKDWFNFVHLSLVVCYVQYSHNIHGIETSKDMSNAQAVHDMLEQQNHWCTESMSIYGVCMAACFLKKFRLGILVWPKQKKRQWFSYRELWTKLCAICNH